MFAVLSFVFAVLAVSCKYRKDGLRILGGLHHHYVRV
jgi:hypothetical protein